jgi:putative membrane protein
MRLLVLNVDRDNDLGRKTGIQAPCIGREAVLRAATALAVADPEEADANGMFAAVKEYDGIAANLEAYGADAVFVAAATGHIREGTQADAAMAHQIDQILEATGADHCILVSDGGEDEHVMPILQTRLKVDGVKRVVIKQSRNLEGFVYLMSRLMNDEKLQRRFFLPLAFLLIAAGVAIGLKRPEIFVMATLFLAAFYIFVQVFKWQEPIGGVFSRIGAQLQAGKLSFVASLVALVVVVWGGVETLNDIADWQTAHQASALSPLVYTLLFVDFIFWRLTAAILIVVVGRALDELVRERRIRPRYWKALAFILAGAVLLRTLVAAAVKYYVPPGKPLEQLLTAHVLTQVFFGAFLLFVGLIMRRYYQQMQREAGPGMGIAK